MPMLKWWPLLYYPLIFLLLVIGYFLNRWLAGHAEMQRKSDIELGCAFVILLLAGPLIVSVVQIIYRVLPGP
jgi:hypothetical protein